MADWSKPTITSNYANYTSEITGLFSSLVKGMDSNLISDANVPANAVRWNSTGFKWERYSGSVWGDLAATYGITAAYAANLAAGGAGQVAYQSAAGTTGFTATGAAGSVLTSGGNSVPTWTPQANLVITGSAMLGVAQTYTKAQRGAYNTLTDAANISVDLSLANNYKVQLAGNRTLSTPTNVVAGQSGVIDVYQDATGSRILTYAWPYQFASGTAPTLSTTKFALDTLAYSVGFYKSMTVTAITNGANAVATSVGHTMLSGQKCQFSALTGSTGLALATSYWATVVDADTFKLSNSLANCVAGNFITTSSNFTSGTLEASTITISPLLGVA